MTDPLNINIGGAGVDTSFPLLPEADYPMQIVESTIKPNKKQNGYNWHLKLTNTAPATAVDGRQVKPNGVNLFIDCALQPADDAADPEGFKRGLFQVVDGIFGTTKENRPDFNKALVDSATGKNVIAHVYVDEYQGEKNNKIKSSRLKKA